MNQPSTDVNPTVQSTVEPNPVLGIRIDPWIDQLAIPPFAKFKLQEANARIRGYDAFCRAWNRLLTQSERNAIGLSADEAFARRSIGNYYSALRGVSLSRAVLEIASQLDYLSVNDKDWLLRELNEVPPILTNAEKPNWNSSTGVLEFRGRSIELSRRAGNQRAILDAVQKHDWAPLAPNPFETPTNIDEQKVHATLRDLNKTIIAIGVRFATEKGRICWMASSLSSLQSNSQ